MRGPLCALLSSRNVLAVGALLAIGEISSSRNASIYQRMKYRRQQSIVRVKKVTKTSVLPAKRFGEYNYSAFARGE